MSTITLRQYLPLHFHVTLQEQLLCRINTRIHFLLYRYIVWLTERTRLRLTSHRRILRHSPLLPALLFIPHMNILDLSLIKVLIMWVKTTM